MIDKTFEKPFTFITDKEIFMKILEEYVNLNNNGYINSPYCIDKEFNDKMNLTVSNYKTKIDINPSDIVPSVYTKYQISTTKELYSIIENCKVAKNNIAKSIKMKKSNIRVLNCSLNTIYKTLLIGSKRTLNEQDKKDIAYIHKLLKEDYKLLDQYILEYNIYDLAYNLHKEQIRTTMDYLTCYNNIILFKETAKNNKHKALNNFKRIAITKKKLTLRTDLDYLLNDNIVRVKRNKDEIKILC